MARRGHPSHSEVARLIEEARTNGSTELDLSSQGLTELMGDCRSGLQNGREVVLGQFVDRGGQQRADLGGGRRARQHPELAEMVARPEPEQFALAVRQPGVDAPGERLEAVKPVAPVGRQGGVAYEFYLIFVQKNGQRRFWLWRPRDGLQDLIDTLMSGPTPFWEGLEQCQDGD